MQDNRQVLGIALVVCRHPQNGKFLAVHETNDTWWLPGGRVDAPEFFTEAAIRETIEEGGINVNIKGVLRLEISLSPRLTRFKVIFYAQPKDPNQKAKDFKDKQSLQAAYMSLEEIKAIRKKWRGPQLHDWANYISNGGQIYPMDILQQIEK